MTEAEVREAIANYLCHFDVANRLVRKMVKDIGWEVDRQILQDIIEHCTTDNEIE